MREINLDLGNCYRKKTNTPKVGSARSSSSAFLFPFFYPRGYFWNVTFVKFAVNTLDAQP